MRFTLILFLLYVSTAMYAQTHSSPCAILHKAVNTYEFKRLFYKCKDAHIAIIDTGLKFADCPITDSCSQLVLVLNKKIDYSPNGIRPGPESKADIVLYGFEHKGASYTLRFWQPYTNRTLESKLIYKRGTAKVEYEHKGDF